MLLLYEIHLINSLCTKKTICCQKTFEVKKKHFILDDATKTTTQDLLYLYYPLLVSCMRNQRASMSGMNQTFTSTFLVSYTELKFYLLFMRSADFNNRQRAMYAFIN